MLPSQDNTSLSNGSEEIHEYALLAEAQNTKRAYASDWKDFTSWCEKRRHHPFPALPDNVAMYLRECAEKHHLKISTIKRRLAAISDIHKRNGYSPPTTEWIVRNTIKHLTRNISEQTESKRPILVADLKLMLKHCPETLPGLRDKAILLFGFVGAFRRAELVGINVDDLSISDQGIVVTIRDPNSARNKESRKVAIPYGRDLTTCPVRTLLRWLKESSIAEGALFRAVTKSGRPRTTRMNDRAVSAIVKRYCKLIGKKNAHFSSHSLRSGLATSAAMAGASESSIQKQTGHKSLIMLRKYIGDAALFRENVALKLGL